MGERCRDWIFAKKEPELTSGYHSVGGRTICNSSDLVSDDTRIVQGGDFARLQAQKNRLDGRVG